MKIFEIRITTIIMFETYYNFVTFIKSHSITYKKRYFDYNSNYIIANNFSYNFPAY